MNCAYCGVEENLPFRCSYCSKEFCADHRLPESHACVALERGKPLPRREVSAQREFFSRPFRFRYTVGPPIRVRRGLYMFTGTELLHLAVGAALVLGVGYTALARLPMTGVLTGGLVLVASFLLHEIAHKFAAQTYGLWAEFRVDFFGALITLISIFSPFKIIAPGAVMISGAATIPIVGRVAVVGPLTNIVMGVGFLVAQSMWPQGLAGGVLDLGAYINGLLAVFNLIPFGVLDGYKVFSWDKRIWAGTLGLAVLILVTAFVT